jgi:hypothetical protein
MFGHHTNVNKRNHLSAAIEAEQRMAGHFRLFVRRRPANTSHPPGQILPGWRIP